MNWFDYLSWAVGAIGIFLAVGFYLELRKWAHLIKYGRIVVAYKNKVRLNAPIQEWALWAKMAERDKSSNGRVVYSMGQTRVALIRKSFVPDPPLKRLIKKIKRTPPPQGSGTGPQVREGSWSAEDQTEKVK